MSRQATIQAFTDARKTHQAARADLLTAVRALPTDLQSSTDPDTVARNAGLYRQARASVLVAAEMLSAVGDDLEEAGVAVAVLVQPEVVPFIGDRSRIDAPGSYISPIKGQAA